MVAFLAQPTHHERVIVVVMVRLNRRSTIFIRLAGPQAQRADRRAVKDPREYGALNQIMRLGIRPNPTAIQTILDTESAPFAEGDSATEKIPHRLPADAEEPRDGAQPQTRLIETNGLFGLFYGEFLKPGHDASDAGSFNVS